MNDAQKIQIERLRLGSFNALDGNYVADRLGMNQHLWLSFLFGRFKYSWLIELKDLPDGYVNADTLYILANKKNLPLLLDEINTWSADEVGWATSEDSYESIGMTPKELASAFGSYPFPAHLAVVRAWWD